MALSRTRELQGRDDELVKAIILITSKLPIALATYANERHRNIVLALVKSVNNQNPQAQNINGNHTKKVWKATRKHNVNTTKTAWRPKKGVGSVKPQWRPTGRILGSKGRTVADSIAERLTRPTAYKFKTDCMILWNAEERDVVPPGAVIRTVIIDPHGIRGQTPYEDYMADESVPAPAPIRSEEQILPFAAWVPIEIATFIWIFTRSKRIQLSIYIQQFWNTLAYEAKTSVYNFQLDETRFTLDANLLREALEITPIDQARQFVSPPSGDAIMDFVNELGYTEAIHFVSRMAASPTKKGRKDKPRVIPYCRFTKLIICHLGRIHNIHQRSTSLFHLAEEDFRLSNLKFVPKGEHDQKVVRPKRKEKSDCIVQTTQRSKSATEKSSKPAPAAKPKPAKEKPSKPSTAKPPKPKPAKPTPLQKTTKGKVTKVRNVKSSFQLVDEPNEEPAQPETEPKLEQKGEVYDMERAIQMSLESFQAQGHAHVGGVAIQEPVAEAIRPLPVVEGKGKAIVTKEQAAQSLLALQLKKDDTSANIIRDSPSSADAEAGAGSDKTNSGGDTEARSDPGETHESRPPPEQVHESLTFLADEHVILEDPLSSTGTLSSMKNMEDAYAIGDQFINDKSTEDEPRKLNVEAEVVSMVTVPIYQASSSVPPLSIPVIDLSPPKPASSTT
ncbi:hypothetical protein Tco_1056217 [Tanacetum coccineum]|uniref:Uncharacterized protein n=1 Tax=Tanacetum coccineum TaxID=301880 RepID=A0ABQ5H1W0_9ASTR